MINAIPWFVGRDAAAALGYGKGKSLNNAVSKHVDNDDKGFTEMMTPGGKQNTIVINESGLYSLILSSKLPTAQKFKRWVTSEVLPSIRKYGAYMTPETIEKVLYNPEFIINLASQLKAEQEKNEVLTKENKALLTENDILMGEIQTYDGRKIITALVRALASRNFNNDFSYAWNFYYKQLRYKHSIDLKIRRGKSKGKEPLITYLRDSEVGKAASLAAAICKDSGVDIEKAINAHNAVCIS